MNFSTINKQRDGPFHVNSLDLWIFRSFQPYVDHLLTQHKLPYHAVVQDFAIGKVPCLDVALTALAIFLDSSVCLFLPNSIWLSDPIYTINDLADFGLFLCVDEGIIYNMCLLAYAQARNISLPDVSAAEDPLNWMRDPRNGASKCCFHRANYKISHYYA